MSERYIIKLYEKTGAFSKTINQADIAEIPDINESIDLGVGAINLKLNIPFDAFFTKYELTYLTRVEINYYSKDYVNGIKTFTGYIPRINPILEASKNLVSITVFGYGSMLKRSQYRDGSGDGITYTETEPKTILENIISNFNAKYFDSIVWDAAQVETVGVNVSIDFENQTWWQAIKKVVEASGASYYWGVNANREFYFKKKSLTPIHRFHLSKNIEKLTNLGQIDDIVNLVRVYYDDLANYVSNDDASSISQFGEVFKRYNESSALDSATATQIASQKIEENKNPKKAIQFTVNKSYDLKSINVGDTCDIMGDKIGSTMFNKNMQIVSIARQKDSAKLTLEKKRDQLAEAIQRLNG